MSFICHSIIKLFKELALYRISNWQCVVLCNAILRSPLFIKVKGKVVYGQEPPSGESTTTECGVNYQLLAVITEVAQCGAPSCSQPQPATDNGVRDGRSNRSIRTPHPTQGSTQWAPRIAHCNAGCKSKHLLHWVSREPMTSECQTNALPVRPLRV